MSGWCGLLLFGAFVLFLAIDFPIALALGGSSLLTILVFDLAPLELVPQVMFGTVDSFTLLAIPFFVFAGMILGHTTLSKRLVDLAESIVGGIPGGLGIVGIIAAVFFAGISGSGPADVAALGLVLLGPMYKAGYPRPFSGALIAASGGIGILVPPSIALIIYGFIAEVSIPKLFVAGIIPGLIVAISLSTVTFIISKRKGYGGTTGRESGMSILMAFKRAVWGLLAPVIILGGIYGGIFTPTEAAAVAVVYSLAVDMLVYRSMFFGDIIPIAARAAVTTAVILSIVAAASLFAWIMNTQGIARDIAAFLVGLSTGKVVMLLLINAILIFTGLVLDAISIFYILLPIFLPVIRMLGIDPIHFGVIVTLNLAIGQITPPVGVNLVAASGVTGLSVGRLSRAVLPFIAGEICALLVVTYMPPLSLFLPGLMQ